MKTTTPTQQPRLIEATQFTVQDFEVFKTGTAFDNKFRQTAMAKLVEEEKNPESELNKFNGGLQNVRRIRVMRDASDTEGANLTLTYETKVSRNEIVAKRSKEDQEKASNLRFTFPLWVADTKGYFKKMISEAVEWLDATPSLPKDIATALEAVSKKVEESKMDRLTLQEARIEVYKLVNEYTGGPKDLADTTGWAEEAIAALTSNNQAKSQLFQVLDYLAAYLKVISVAVLDKASLIAFANSQRTIRPQGKPAPGKYRNNNHGPRNPKAPSSTKPQQRA